LIIGNLIGIALPIFLGARERAQNRAATTDLRTGLAAALTYFPSHPTGTDSTLRRQRWLKAT
jgi:type IV pilus assembly protein PilA